MLKAIHAQESRQAASRKAAEVVASLKARKLTKAAELVESPHRGDLQLLRLPRPALDQAEDQQSAGEASCGRSGAGPAWSGAFPDGQSALNLAAARLRHIAGTKWSTKRYMNIDLLKQQRMTA